MSDYVAYHSTEIMQGEYKPGDSTTFWSRKPRSVLEGAIGERAWAISGTKDRTRRTHFSLIAVYRPSYISASTDIYEITGPTEFAFDPPIELTELDWFLELKREQSNFSLGFNPIRSARVIAALEELLDERRT